MALGCRVGYGDMGMLIRWTARGQQEAVPRFIAVVAMRQGLMGSVVMARQLVPGRRLGLLDDLS